MNKTVIIVLAIPFIILSVILILGLTYSYKPEIPAGAPGSYIEIDGLKIRYLQMGNGHDIVFVHGVICSLEDFIPAAEILSKKYRVTLFDRPGCGYSEVDKSHYSLSGNSSIIKGLIEKLDLKKPVIVGHSHGASIAMQFAAEHQGMARGFFLMGLCCYPEEVIPFREAPAAEIVFGRLIETPLIGEGISRILMPLAGKSILSQSTRDIFAPAEIPAGYLESRYGWMSDPRVIVTLFRNANGFNEEIKPWYPLYPKLKEKFSIVQGLEDFYSDQIPNAKKLAQEIPGTKLVLLPATGHMVYIQHPQLVLEGIDELAKY